MTFSSCKTSFNNRTSGPSLGTFLTSHPVWSVGTSHATTMWSAIPFAVRDPRRTPPTPTQRPTRAPRAQGVTTVTSPAYTATLTTPSTSRSCSATTRPTGLRAIIGIYSTALGPALGGTRFYPYAERGGRAQRRAATCPGHGLQERASPAWTTAVARPSSSATPPRTRPRALLRPTGGSSSRLGGRYVTACDVGTYVADMDVVARESQYVTGRTRGGRRRRRLLGAHRARRLPGHARRRRAPVGRTHPHGRTRGHRRRRQGRSPPRRAPARGRRVGGRHRRQRADAVAGQAHHPEVEAVAAPPPLAAADLDVYAPCALGRALDAADGRPAATPPSSAAAPTTSWWWRARGGTADRLKARGIDLRAGVDQEVGRVGDAARLEAVGRRHPRPRPPAGCWRPRRPPCARSASTVAVVQRAAQGARGVDVEVGAHQGGGVGDDLDLGVGGLEAARARWSTSVTTTVAPSSIRCPVRIRPTLPTPAMPTVRPPSVASPHRCSAQARWPWKTPYAVRTEESPAPPLASERPVANRASRSRRPCRRRRCPRRRP